MSKNMYSLMIDCNIIDLIDDIAAKKQCTRSSLINKILADYINYRTPEQKLFDIYERLNFIFNDNSLFDILHDKTSNDFSIKSSLDIKYKPSIKYEILLYKNKFNKQIGQIKVLFRTQSKWLINQLTDFFEQFIQLETYYLNKFYKEKEIKYSYDLSKFTRTFTVNEKHYNSDEKLANSIAKYIENFDFMLKKYMYNQYKNIEEIEVDYLNFLRRETIII